MKTPKYFEINSLNKSVLGWERFRTLLDKKEETLNQNLTVRNKFMKFALFNFSIGYNQYRLFRRV